jgi:hypothetical protein
MACDQEFMRWDLEAGNKVGGWGNALHGRRHLPPPPPCSRAASRSSWGLLQPEPVCLLLLLAPVADLHTAANTAAHSLQSTRRRRTPHPPLHRWL